MFRVKKRIITYFDFTIFNYVIIHIFLDISLRIFLFKLLQVRRQVLKTNLRQKYVSKEIIEYFETQLIILSSMSYWFSNNVLLVDLLSVIYIYLLHAVANVL